ncbi:hypothetical protein Nepgr_008537 [Nepenthes gracilis]|uniref:Uncharacterized protein n=1 Tax=Nepenthes gracilis TaxID=150966 RepID=A0AAD3S937_NEPGR|nr:hypothetical protein Nepgr_008537 [Nepenthes gracilis]
MEVTHCRRRSKSVTSPQQNPALPLPPPMHHNCRYEELSALRLTVRRASSERFSSIPQVRLPPYFFDFGKKMVLLLARSSSL